MNNQSPSKRRPTQAPGNALGDATGNPCGKARVDGTERGLVIGTAGHVDHGKSRLVEALTGTNPDRLSEEKRRGITIDLGFAHLDLPGVGSAGIVDVPGHERFVRTMVAGAAGMDLVLLVVALDEGVMPQTREHLDVCRLLGVKRGVVAITKADMEATLGPEWETLVRSDIADAVEGTFLEEAPVITVSADDGRGLEDLVDALAAVSKNVRGRDPSGPLFMPVDRVFTMHGFGTVVTGTMLSGNLKTGDAISLAPSASNDATRVRGLQVHGREVNTAVAGQRVAVNLAGLSKEAVDRGSAIVAPLAAASGKLLDARVEVLAAAKRPLKQRARMQVHIGTGRAEVLVSLLGCSEVPPGGAAFAQLHLDRSLPVLPGQPFIMRGSRVLAGRGRTVAGGLILGLATRRRRPTRSDATLGMEALSSEDTDVLVEEIVRGRGLKGATERELPYLTGLPNRSLRRSVEQLTSRRILVLAEPEQRLLVHADTARRLEEEAVARIEAHHASRPLERGILKEALRSSLAGPPPPRLFHSILAGLSKSGVVETDENRVRIAGQDAAMSKADAEASETVAKYIEKAGLAPPTLSRIAASESMEPNVARTLAMRLEDDGRVVKVKDDLYFDCGAMEDLERRLVSWLDEHEEIDTQSFKEMTGVTRRHTIPLSEYFDRRHVTLRVGNKRIRRRKQQGTKGD